MDSALVEKITRLIVLKLEEHAAYLPLTDKELISWDQITASMNGTQIEKPSTEACSNYPPLTEDELKAWSNITFSMIGTQVEENRQAKFHRYN